MTETTYHCPECGSDQVTTEHHQKFMVNTGDHYCHSIKTHDSDSPATCLSCQWTGLRQDLEEIETEMVDEPPQPNHLCKGRWVHLPYGEHCDKCGRN